MAVTDISNHCMLNVACEAKLRNESRGYKAIRKSHNSRENRHQQCAETESPLESGEIAALGALEHLHRASPS